MIERLKQFPYHEVPDGAVMAPHHLYIGVILMVLATAAVWDDVESDPIYSGGVIAFLLFSFMYVWPFYPIAGALLSLTCILAAAASVWRERRYYMERPRLLGLYVLGLTIVSDDVLEHAFGWPMPLDLFFKHVMVPTGNYLADALNLVVVS